MAFVRIGAFSARPELVGELCHTYTTEAIPAIRSARGNISAVLLQEHADANKFLAITVWATRADAEAYDASGQAASMVAKVRHAFAGPPSLQTYEAFGVPNA